MDIGKDIDSLIKQTFGTGLPTIQEASAQLVEITAPEEDNSELEGFEGLTSDDLIDIALDIAKLVNTDSARASESRKATAGPKAYIRETINWLDVAETTQSEIEATVAERERKAEEMARRLAERQNRDHGIGIVPQPKSYKLSPALALRIERIKARLANGQQVPNTLLSGHPGLGKSEFAYALGAELGMRVLKVDCALPVEPGELFGQRAIQNGATVYERSQLAKALEVGNIVILYDEITRSQPGVVNALMAILDGQRHVTLEDGTLEVGDDIVVVATGNPPGPKDRDIRGIGQALTERFEVVEVTWLPKDDEIDLLVDRTGIDPAIARGIANFAELTRRETARGNLATAVSTRVSLKLAEIVVELKAMGQEPILAIDQIEGAWSNSTLGSGLSERANVRRLWESSF